MTTLGTGVDGGIRRIATTYEVRRMRETVTSYDDATVGQGNIVNEVRFAYNEFGQLTADSQSHSGAVNLMNTPKVQYAYADGSENTIRPTALTYPNGRVLTYDYGPSGGTDDAASRVASLIDDDVSATHLVDYAYLGRDTFVEADYTEPDLKYTLVGTVGGNDPDTGDIYRGLDRFSRVKDSYWYDYGSATDVDRLQYGYDRAGNRLWRKNTVAAALGKSFDELYTYDGLHRLADMQRGALNANRDAVTNLQFAECWQLDETGNWQNFRQDDDGDGMWDLVQFRLANPVNEITGISETTGPVWTAPAYSRAGNLTTIPQPLDPTQSYTATYDAWNRLVTLVDDATSNTVQENAFDGRWFRITRHNYMTGTLDETRHSYYTTTWQTVEERTDASIDPSRQFVWGLRYLDDAVLRDRNTSANGTLDERFYALQDANWNVTGIADADGMIAERYTYGAYGVTTTLTSVFTAKVNSEYDWESLFAAYSRSTTTGLYNVRFRVYHALCGVWLRRDPAPRMPGRTDYQYVAGRPTATLDPLGLQEILGGGLQKRFPCPELIKKDEGVCKILVLAGHHVPKNTGGHQLDELDNWIDQLEKHFGEKGLPCGWRVGGTGCYLPELKSRLEEEFGCTIKGHPGRLEDPFERDFCKKSEGPRELTRLLYKARQEARKLCKDEKCCKQVKIVVCCSKEFKDAVKRFGNEREKDHCDNTSRLDGRNANTFNCE